MWSASTALGRRSEKCLRRGLGHRRHRVPRRTRDRRPAGPGPPRRPLGHRRARPPTAGLFTGGDHWGTPHRLSKPGSDNMSFYMGRLCPGSDPGLCTPDSRFVAGRDGRQAFHDDIRVNQTGIDQGGELGPATVSSHVAFLESRQAEPRRPPERHGTICSRASASAQGSRE
jgi:hypothetical protein